MGLQFTETMRGFFSSDVKDTTSRAQPRRSSRVVSCVSPQHHLRDLNTCWRTRNTTPALGSVMAPALSARPLSVEDGVFNLFVADPTNVETRNMVYRMQMSRRSKVYTSTATNSCAEFRARYLHDSSTLYITVRDGADESAPFSARLLHILPLTSPSR